MYERTYSHIGKVQFVFNSKAKRLILKVKPDGSVWLTLPKYYSLEKAEDFMKSRVEWIIATQKKLAVKRNEQTILQEQQITHFHILRFVETSGESCSGTIRNGVITVCVPQNVNRNSDFVQNTIKELVIHALRIEAKNHIPQRLKSLAYTHNFSYSSIKITSAKTRWGSCSYTNGINISLYIMRLPLELIDFILLHELCHTIHKNHGKEFHALLDLVSQGNKRIFEKELKRYTLH